MNKADGGSSNIQKNERGMRTTSMPSVIGNSEDNVAANQLPSNRGGSDVGATGRNILPMNMQEGNSPNSPQIKDQKRGDKTEKEAPELVLDHMDLEKQFQKFKSLTRGNKDSEK